MSAFETFQSTVASWVRACFGNAAMEDNRERTHRFLEEALELAQATDCTQAEAHQLVDYVYGRAQGTVESEVGGTLLTLAALCAARGLSMEDCGTTELNRVLDPHVMERCRRKQQDKVLSMFNTPLPGRLDMRTAADIKEVPPHLDMRTHTDAVGTTGGKATVASLQPPPAPPNGKLYR